MRYVIISGSHRGESQSLKVSKWIQAHLRSREHTSEVEVISLSNNPLPLWDEAAWDSDSELAALVKPYLMQLESADGLVIVSPEWAGMVPAALKNFLLFPASKHIGHKPCMLVGVSSGVGGAYPIAELRMSGYKNNRMVYIPDHVIIRDVENVMNDTALKADDPDSKDGYIRRRTLHSLSVLESYTKALKVMRDVNPNLLRDEFPYGM